jgi:hypothetical protein
MLIYEVNLEYDMAIAADYRAWLAAHLAEMLALPGFVDAQVQEVVEPKPTAGRSGLSVRYRVRDAESLEAYLRDHAPGMRADGKERFGEDGVRIRRRVLRETTLD